MTRRQRSLLGGLAVAGPVVATAAWAVASATQAGYHSARDDLSALAATGADHPWLTMTGELVLGVGIVALATGLAATLPGQDVVVGSGLLLCAGLATALQAIAREDCTAEDATCLARVHAGHVSWHHIVHEATSAVAFFAILGAPLVLARAFGRHSRWRGVATYSLVTSALGLVLLVVYVASADTSWGGLSERIFLIAPLAWISVAGARLGAA